MLPALAAISSGSTTLWILGARGSVLTSKAAHMEGRRAQGGGSGAAAAAGELSGLPGRAWQAGRGGEGGSSRAAWRLQRTVHAAALERGGHQVGALLAGVAVARGARVPAWRETRAGRAVGRATALERRGAAGGATQCAASTQAAHHALVWCSSSPRCSVGVRWMTCRERGGGACGQVEAGGAHRCSCPSASPPLLPPAPHGLLPCCLPTWP